jgi:hypothetical protein
MKDRSTSRHGHGLQVGQAVEVCGGSLIGLSGVLIDIVADRGCEIELDTVERGIVLIIDSAAVKALPNSSLDQTTSPRPPSDEQVDL